MVVTGKPSTQVMCDGGSTRVSSGHGAVDAWDAPYSMYAVGIAPTFAGIAVVGTLLMLWALRTPPAPRLRVASPRPRAIP